MRYILSLFVLLCCSGNAMAQSSARASIEVTGDGYTLNVDFTGITLQKAEGNWTKVSAKGLAQSLEKGMADIPYKAYSFLIADGMELVVKNSSYTDYTGYDVIPSKGNFDRTKDPSSIPLVAGPVYQQNAFYPANIATVANDYMIRSAHGQAVHISPVQYNPVTHTVRIYSHIELEVKTARTAKPAEASTNLLWDNLYKRQFLNYALLNNAAAKSTYNAPTETGDMLIVTPASYISTLQPFIHWKMERGIRCYIMNMDTVTSGGDPDSIQARIAYHYQQNPNLTYVLLIGDESEMPPMQNSNLAGPSDAGFGYVSGNDHYPDLLVGRFSANTIAELQTQLSKSIEYERNPTSAQAWHKRAMGIGSNEGPGDDSQMDWEHMVGIRSQLLGATYNYVYEAYDDTHDINLAPLDGAGNPGPQEVVDAINAGVSLINYCGHGSSTSMATTGFSNNDVSSLTNTNGEWPFIITVACVTGEFMNGNTSLGEKLMIASQAGQPYGMVGGFMSSINQYWDPPMQGQDEMNDIIANATTVKLYAAAAITAAGCMSMNDAYTGAGYDMTDTWIFFGDPSMQFRYTESDTLTAVHADSMFFYETNLTTQLNKSYGTVVLLHNDTIYSVQHTNTFNTAHNFGALPVGDSLMVIATSPNTKPYYGKVRIVDTPTTIPTSVTNVSATEIALYPNPANNEVSVKGINGITTYRCLDITGRLMLQGTLGGGNGRINTSGLPAGSYILQLDNQNRKISLPMQILR